ncbi:MAG: endonuclease/exonuclease/phosphatase family protein [Rhodospirillales bacterium]|nr:MAG: endonuclease/exonuclease/phosphatase family protein [Rhodospirillales bacterium]
MPLITFSRRLIVIGASLNAFALALGFAAPLLPLGDSFAHFRLHLTATMLLMAILLLILRHWKTAGAAGMISLVGLIGLNPAYSAPVPIASAAPAAPITLVQLNLSFRNRTPEAVADFVRAEGADIVTLQEVTSQTARVITLLEKEYPHRVLCPFARVGGVAVISRLPTGAEPSRGCIGGQGLAWLRVVAAGREISVGSVHLHWPYPFDQSRQIDRLEDRVRSIPRPLVLAGDFNAAPWSHAVGRMAEASGTEVAGGLRFTFDLRPISWAPAIPLPIDHVLLPAGVSPVGLGVGPKAGSDHRSVVARLLVSPSQSPRQPSRKLAGRQ